MLATSSGGPSDRTLNLGRGGAWRCVSLGSVYVAARVGAVCLLACVIACGLCEVPGGAQLRLALVCGWSAVSRREQTEHHKHSPIHSRTTSVCCVPTYSGEKFPETGKEKMQAISVDTSCCNVNQRPWMEAHKQYGCIASNCVVFFLLRIQIGLQQSILHRRRLYFTPVIHWLRL